MRVELLGADRGDIASGSRRVPPHEALDSVNAETTACTCRKERLIPAPRPFAHPDLEDRLGDSREGNGAELATYDLRVLRPI